MAVTTLRVKVGDRWYTVQVADLTHSPVEVTVDGETLYVEIEGLTPPPPTRPTRGQPPSSATSRPAPSDNILRSPMPGRVISIPVHPGDRVSEGDEVCVIEAMKMEQSVRAFRDGIVKTVYVQPLDSVRANDPLVELE